MELFRLRTFAVVAKHQSISAAAKELHLSQPAVTRQMQSLENTLGLPLLERQGRISKLTLAGETLLEHTELILQAVDNCLEQIENLRLGRTGRLSLGAGLTTIAFTLPKLIQEYKRRLPNVELSITSGTTQEILRLVLDKQVDLGFVTSPVKHPKCHVQPLFNDQIVLVSNAEHRLAGISISPHELAELPLILYGPSGFRDFVINALWQAGIKPKITMELDSIEGIKRMVAVGVGHAFVPVSAVQEELAKGELVRRPMRGMPALFRQTCLVYLQQDTLNLPTATFLEIARNNWPNPANTEGLASRMANMYK